VPGLKDVFLNEEKENVPQAKERSDDKGGLSARSTQTDVGGCATRLLRCLISFPIKQYSISSELQNAFK
jgi:hypothetical protein